MTGTARRTGSPAPSSTTTVTAALRSYGVPVMTAPTSASAGGVPKAASWPVTGVARSPTAVTLLPGGPLKLLACLATIVQAPVPA